MPASIFDDEVTRTLADAQAAARDGRRTAVRLGGGTVAIQRPYPSPADWRDTWIYFLLLDRFRAEHRAPAGVWNQRFDHRQGGTFNGVRGRLPYLRRLGVRAIWLSPVVKNARPDWPWNYHGYGLQDLLNIDERFASDGTQATAERELTALVNEAHARGIHVILDIVLNHTARVFDYVTADGVRGVVERGDVMQAPPGGELPVQWLNGFGQPRPDWQDSLPPATALSPDDAVWPTDLQRTDFFRRRGGKLTDEAENGFVRGDFGDMRQLVVEYDARGTGQEALRARYGAYPVLSVLIRAYAYLMARYDFDGYRLDTVKYVDASMIETFGNAMREFALSLGKRNFFTFGEVYDREAVVARFVGRNGGDGFGIDAALDFPLFFTLPAVAKGQADVSQLKAVFDERKRQERELLSSHGEAGRFFVSFLDNHDQHERIQHPDTPERQVTLALTLLFTLQGIPSIYYGTEQGLSGTVDVDGRPDLSANESTREALWGKPDGFSTRHPRFVTVRALSALREAIPALRYGRLYFREVSGNGADFGLPTGAGGIVAFSRILAEAEVLVVANTGTAAFAGSVLVDRDIHATARTLRLAYANTGLREGAVTSHTLTSARFWSGASVSTGMAAVVDVRVEPGEALVFAP